MLLKAIESRWVNGANNLKPIATVNDLKLLHNFAVQLITARVKELNAPIYELYHIGIMPMAKALRVSASRAA